MRRLTLAVFAALMMNTALVQAQSLLDTIHTPGKTVPVRQPDAIRQAGYRNCSISSHSTGQ